MALRGRVMVLNSLVVVCLVAISGCAEDRVVGPEGSVDGGSEPGAPDARPTTPGADAGEGGGSAECNMAGQWVVAQVTFSTALGSTQTSVNWFWHDISQSGDAFTIDDSLNCGFRVTGSTTVTLDDDTLAALAEHNSSSVGRKGTMKLTGDSSACDFSLGRAYNLRGANYATFLSNVWSMGDPDKPLSEFPQLPGNAAAGMEDWDGDGVEGITLSTGFGERYVAQRDYNEHHGIVPKNADEFGGAGVVIVEWDGQEAVSDETPPLLRTGSTPDGDGYAYYKRVDGELEIGATDLATCKNVQRIALETWPNP